jgi:hypothetical protein
MDRSWLGTATDVETRPCRLAGVFAKMKPIAKALNNGSGRNTDENNSVVISEQ